MQTGTFSLTAEFITYPTLDIKKGGEGVFSEGVCSEARAHRQPFDQLSGPVRPEDRARVLYLE